MLACAVKRLRVNPLAAQLTPGLTPPVPPGALATASSLATLSAICEAAAFWMALVRCEMVREHTGPS